MTTALGRPYLLLLFVVAVERLAELVVSRRHRRVLTARGGVEHCAGHYPWMVALHGVFFAACLAEPLLLHRAFHAWLTRAAAGVVTGAMVLRFWTMAALGDRWTTRVIVVADEPLIRSGPYRWLRHPNYAAVLVELFVIPLAHTAWLTSLVLGSLNAALLCVRVRCEEAALALSPEYLPPSEGCRRRW